MKMKWIKTETLTGKVLREQKMNREKIKQEILGKVDAYAILKERLDPQLNGLKQWVWRYEEEEGGIEKCLDSIEEENEK